MLRQARLLRPGPNYLCGDAAQLPLPGQSQQLVFSSLALQWCTDFAAVLREAERVLTPGGVLAFSSLAEGTLLELNRSWQATGSGERVNRFRSLDRYRQLCAASGMQLLVLECRPRVQHYPDAGCDHLRQIATPNTENAPACWDLQPISDCWHAGTATLARRPAQTWQVVYAVLRKTK